ncbi:MAG TPA: hypothetical protein VF783_09155, partial [Terriglobales bacterium]
GPSRKRCCDRSVWVHSSFLRQIRGEPIMELCGIEVREVVGYFLDCARVIEITGEALPILRFAFASIGQLGCHLDLD